MHFVAESSSEAIEHSINHPEVDEGNQRNQSDPIHENGTDNETFHDSQLIQSRFDDSLNGTRLVQDISAELQRDQSAAVSFAAEQNEVEAEESEQKPMERNNKIQGTSRIFPTSTESVRENVSSTASSKIEDELNRVQVDEQAPSDTLDEQGITNGFKVEKQRDFIFTTTSSRETIATDSRQIEQKNVEDIRAISFQVPAAAGEETRQQEQPRNPGETRKDHSRPVNNLLLAGGKSTKGFYEIKPSIKTEMEDDQAVSSTQRPLSGKKFVLPSVDSAFGKFGPYFEDGDQDMNITARIGSKMLLDCKIGMLGDKEVT